MLRSEYHLFINGEQKEGENGEWFEVYNPATEEVLTKAAKATTSDVDLAVKAARSALESGSWPRLTGAKRARILNKIAAIMRERLDNLVELEVLNSGKTVPTAKGQIIQAIEDFEFYASATVTLSGETVPMPNRFFTYTLKEPVGVCGQIIPWNYPLMMAAWKVAPALAAGCTVVLKPASLTPIQLSSWRKFVTKPVYLMEWSTSLQEADPSLETTWCSIRGLIRLLLPVQQIRGRTLWLRRPRR